MKAMALRPADRYASPRALADDLERWLADKPVSAWPEPILVRAKRWARQHQTLVTSSAASLFIALIALAAGLHFYQDAENRRAKDLADRQQAESLRELEAERKRAAAEEAIKNALDQSEKPYTELHAILAKPGGVFVLSNEPARWKANIQSATTSLRAAQDMLGTAEPGVDPALAERAARLKDVLERDESDRQLAVTLEKIRTDRATWVEGQFDDRRAQDQYSAVFAEAYPGMEAEKDPPTAVVAARLRESPIRELLLAAIADWGLVASRVGSIGLAWRLLDIGQKAAPESVWVDKFRKINVKENPSELAKLVKEAPISMLSPPILEVIAAVYADQATKVAWLRQAQAQYPGDFWLNFSLGNVLVQKDPVEAAVFFRIAIGVRPKSVGAYHNLGYSLELQKKQDEAIAAYQKAIELDPKSAHAYNSLAFALNTQKNFPKALEAFHKAIKCDSKFAMAHRGLGIALFETGQFAKAAESFQTGADLFKTGRWHKDCLDRLEQCRRMQKL
jgi:tetratricopeptide (TPR) repeat protein